MTILLSNDDGIESPGIIALEEALVRHRPGDEIWVVAPDGDRSGRSHSITIREPIRSIQRDERHFAISGTPADCISTAVHGIMGRKPDLVLSGINLGPNLGTDITYSGTAAAARQAAYMDIPAVALSLDSFIRPFHFEALTNFAVRHLETLLKLWDSDHFINVNGPSSPREDLEIRVTHPCRRRYDDSMVKFEAPSKEVFYFLQGLPVDNKDEEGSDWQAVAQDAISVSPIHLHPVIDKVDRRYREAFGLE